MKALLSLIERHKQGQAVGMYSVCSAHPLVLEAAFKQAEHDQQLVLIESTSNQVNQFGGYTGLTPRMLASQIFSLAKQKGFSLDNVILGGDHLGPNCWQHLSAKQAMEHAAQMVHDYVCAGFRKIHLDCSMPCADDISPLSEAVMVQRAAHLCFVAEQAWKSIGGPAPVYVIGSEVPTPGGATENLSPEEVKVTTPKQALTTLDAHHRAFTEAGLTYVWKRVIALVVQPGVEFDHHNVLHYNSAVARSLSELIESQPNLVYEAHSTDYQAPHAYHEMVRDHFAFLKVGPALTFALREALFGLDRAEQEWIGSHRSSHLRDTIEQVMREQPSYWLTHYSSQGHEQYLDRSFSLSDRIRYYWSHPSVQAAQRALFDNLVTNPIPVTLISQYLPNQAKAIVQKEISNHPSEIVVHKIMEVLAVYSQACYCNRTSTTEPLQ